MAQHVSNKEQLEAHRRTEVPRVIDDPLQGIRNELAALRALMEQSLDIQKTMANERGGTPSNLQQYVQENTTCAVSEATSSLQRPLQTQLEERPAAYLVGESLKQHAKTVQRCCGDCYESLRSTLTTRMDKLEQTVNRNMVKSSEMRSQATRMDKLEQTVNRNMVKSSEMRSQATRMDKLEHTISENMVESSEMRSQTHLQFQKCIDSLSKRNRRTKRRLDDLEETLSNKRRRLSSESPLQVELDAQDASNVGIADIPGDTTSEAYEYDHVGPESREDEDIELAEEVISTPDRSPPRKRTQDQPSEIAAVRIYTVGPDGRLQDASTVPDVILEAARGIAQDNQWEARWSGQCLFSRRQQNKNPIWSHSGGDQRSCKMCANACRPCLRIIRVGLLLLELPDEVSKDRPRNHPEHWVRIKRGPKHWTDKAIWAHDLLE